VKIRLDPADLEKAMQGFLALQAGDDDAAMKRETRQARREAAAMAGTLGHPKASAASGGAGRPESKVN
jgi:hypothetical protein